MPKFTLLTTVNRWLDELTFSRFASIRCEPRSASTSSRDPPDFVLQSNHTTTPSHINLLAVTVSQTVSQYLLIINVWLLVIRADVQFINLSNEESVQFVARELELEPGSARLEIGKDERNRSEGGSK